MTLRPAVTGDAPGIAGIWNHYIRDTVVTFTTAEKSGDDIAELILSRERAGHGTFVLVERETVVGFATYAQFRSGPGYAHTLEHSVLLAPGMSGAGRGRKLLTAVLEHARGAGGHSLYAGISSGNPGAVAFHAAMGFEPAVILPEAGRKNGAWFDLHLMRRWL